MHNRLICASQRAENSRPPAAPIRRYARVAINWPRIVSCGGAPEPVVVLASHDDAFDPLTGCRKVRSYPAYVTRDLSHDAVGGVTALKLNYHEVIR
jgi:hypothetical protein